MTAPLTVEEARAAYEAASTACAEAWRFDDDALRAGRRTKAIHDRYSESIDKMHRAMDALLAAARAEGEAKGRREAFEEAAREIAVMVGCGESAERRYGYQESHAVCVRLAGAS